MIKINQIENFTFVQIKGKVWKGKGSSNKWMPKYFPDLYPGTVNVKLLEDKPKIIYKNKIETEYGICYFTDCKFNDLDAFIILPPMGLNKLRLVEVGAVFPIRKTLSLKDKDIVNVTFIV